MPTQHVFHVLLHHGAAYQILLMRCKNDLELDLEISIVSVLREISHGSPFI